MMMVTVLVMMMMISDTIYHEHHQVHRTIAKNHHTYSHRDFPQKPVV